MRFAYITIAFGPYLTYILMKKTQGVKRKNPDPWTFHNKLKEHLNKDLTVNTKFIDVNNVRNSQNRGKDNTPPHSPTQPRTTLEQEAASQRAKSLRQGVENDDKESPRCNGKRSPRCNGKRSRSPSPSPGPSPTHSPIHEPTDQQLKDAIERATNISKEKCPDVRAAVCAGDEDAIAQQMQIEKEHEERKEMAKIVNLNWSRFC